MDLIRRQQAIDALMAAIDDVGILDGADIKAVFDNLPPAQPEPKEGHWTPNEGYWIKYDERFPWRHLYKCSECGNYLDFSGVNGGRAEPHFCPNCGAKMKGE